MHGDGKNLCYELKIFYDSYDKIISGMFTMEGSAVSASSSHGVWEGESSWHVENWGTHLSHRQHSLRPQQGTSEVRTKIR